MYLNFVYLYIIIAFIQIIFLNKCEILLLKYPKKRIEIKEKKTGKSNSYAYESIKNHLDQKYKLEVENKKKEKTIRFYKNKSILIDTGGIVKYEKEPWQKRKKEYI